MTHTIKAIPKYSDEEIKKLEGYFIQDHHIDQIIDYDCDAYKENGEPLFFFRKNIIPNKICENAYKSLRHAVAKGGNRGAAGGVPQTRTGKVGLKWNEDGTIEKTNKTGKTRGFRVNKNGTISKTHEAFNKVESGIAGYFDRQTRIPYCRQTSFNEHQFEKFKNGYPYIKYISDLFKDICPPRWQAQKDMIDKTSKDFYIADTVFTTITVNRNFRTAIHTDKGDLAEGFGNLGVLEAGNYDGAYTVFPKYKIGFDVRSTDVCFMDVHEYHGNTAIKGKGKYERISVVCYYRKNMVFCKSALEEMEIAKRLKNRANLNK
jgi:hypothetical protein